MRRKISLGGCFAIALFVTIVAGAAWSFASGGMVWTMVDTAGSLGDNEASLEALRQVLLRWGALAPVVYVAAVVVEVLVAPIPGTLLYAPAGALFGGFYGGLLSLIGNTIGAMVACGVSGALGEAVVARRLEGSAVAKHVAAIRANALWVVLLLRLNPLTSSDLVSYAAGAIGVPIWRVGVATLVGMAPLCFAQAYLAEQIFRVLPGAVYILIGAGLLYVTFLIVWLTRQTGAGGTR